MPCEKLAHLDNRYRDLYGMSMVANLREIEENGVASFLKNQGDKYKCSNCGDVISVHNGKCYVCNHVTNPKNSK
jgi:hypothetical protein